MFKRKYSSITHAIQEANYDHVVKMHKAGCSMDITNIEVAAEIGDLNILEYLYEHGCPCNKDAMEIAATNGHLDCLKYLNKCGFELDIKVVNLAAKNGHLDCIQYAYTRGCKWDESTTKSAAKRGHLHCLQYLVENGCPVNQYALSYAAQNGHLDCVKYLVENNCEKSKDAMAYAAQFGHLDCLKYMFEHGCEWDESTTSLAAFNGELECLKFAHENGCPWNQNLFYVKKNPSDKVIECLNYAWDHGCPDDQKNSYEHVDLCSSEQYLNNTLDREKIQRQLEDKLFVQDDMQEQLQNKECVQAQEDFEHDTPEIQFQKVCTLIDIIGHDHCDEYDKWLDVSLAIIQIFSSSPPGNTLFHKFSALSSKYNEEEFQYYWYDLLSSFHEHNKQNGFSSLYCLANQYDTFTTEYLHKFSTIENYQQPQSSYDTYTFAKIIVSFQPDMVVHTPQLDSHFYPNILTKCPYDQKICLAIKSGCGTGKTFNLPSIFEDKRILIIVFRVSLGQEMLKQYQQHGFKYYKSENNKYINEFYAQKYPRLIVTVDSLHKVYGSYDMVLIDEFCSVAKHIFEDTVKDKVKTLEHFLGHITHARLNVCLDANLNDDMLHQIFKTHFIFKVHNTYSKYQDTVANFILVKHKKKEYMNHEIVKEIQAGKRVVICSNSASFIEQNKLFIEAECPDTRILSYTQKNKHEIDTSKWDTVQVLSYSPTITAGISWNPDEPHFDCLYAYFVNGEHTCDIDSCLQQLFRVRRLREKRMHIVISPDMKSTTYPLTYASIKNYINNRINSCGYYLKERPWIKYDVITGESVQNTEFYLYQLYIKENNLSKVYFASYMHTLLTQYGMKINVDMPDKDTLVKELQPTTDLMKEIDKELHKIQLDEMVKTEVIDSDAFYALERKKVKTREEFLRWVKYQTYLAFDIPITATFINDAEKQCLLDASNIGYKYFNLMTFVKQYKTIDDQVTYCKQKHVEQYDSILDTLLECDIDYAKPDKSIEEQLKSLLLKTSPKSAVIKMLTKDIYLKQYYTLRAIQSIGLTSGSDSTVVENLFLLTVERIESELNLQVQDKTTKKKCVVINPYEKVSKYLNEHQGELSLLFPSEFRFDKEKQKTLKGYARFMNNMLNIFGLKFEKVGDANKKQYQLQFINLDLNVLAIIKKRVQNPV